MTSKSATPTSGLSAELNSLLAAERDPPRIAEPMRAALTARLVAAAEADAADRATPWWAGVRLKPWSVAFGVAVLSGGVVWASFSGEVVPSAPVRVAASAAAAPREAALKAPAVSAVPAAPVGAARAAATPPSLGVALPQASPTAERAAVAIADELSGLEQARAAQQRGEHADALRAIAAHERKYPGSIFVEEREALRVSALGKLGRTTEARTRARAFVNRYPRSIFVSKLSPWLSD